MRVHSFPSPTTWFGGKSLVTTVRNGWQSMVRALLTRFDMRGAEVGLGLTQTFYGLGGAFDVGNHPGLPLIALLLGVLAQVAAYSGPPYLRRVVNSLNCALWVFLAFYRVHTEMYAIVGLDIGLALTAALVSIRATAAFGPSPGRTDRRCHYGE